MEILLRSASSLARACGQTASTLLQKFELEADISFSAHVMDGENTDEITTRLEQASRQATQNLNDILDLYQAQAKLRELIGEANVPAKINALLAERDVYLHLAEKALKAHLNSIVNPISSLGGRSHVKHDANEVAGRLTGIRRRMQTVTSDVVADTVRASKLSEADRQALEDQLSHIQRRQRDLNDELSHANTSRKIKIPDNVVAILRKHKIV